MASPRTSLGARVWNRLGRVPAFHPFFERTNDRARALSFQFNSTQRTAILEEYKKCQSPESYFSFTKDIPYVKPHQISFEIVGFLNFIASRSPLNVCEIGTADGGTNFLLSQAIPSVKLMVGIDLFVRNTFCLRYFSRPGQELHFLNGSSYAPESVAKFAQVLGGRELDILFIDGDHTYEGARKDFQLYKEYVREGGIIAFHDIVPDYKTRYGRETGRWAGDVPRLWAKIKSLYPSHEFVENPEQDGLGIGCIEYRKAVELPADL
jgi:cephalosporin hydroxylase